MVPVSYTHLDVYKRQVRPFNTTIAARMHKIPATPKNPICSPSISSPRMAATAGSTDAMTDTLPGSMYFSAVL